MELLPKEKKIVVERTNKVVYDCGDMMVKVFNTNKHAADILNEALNLTRAEQAGIAVPSFRGVGKEDGSWMLATDKAVGPTLRELIDENPENLDQYLEYLVDVEIDIHKHTSLLLTRQKDKYSRMISQVEALDEATRYDLHMRLDGMPNHDKVCHGDFSPSNVIITENGAVVCDWAHATSGNGAADAATSYLLFRMRGDDEVAERFLKMYCKRAGTDMGYVQSWLSIVAAAELARGRVSKKDLLMSMVHVVDYV